MQAAVRGSQARKRLKHRKRQKDKDAKSKAGKSKDGKSGGKKKRRKSRHKRRSTHEQPRSPVDDFLLDEVQDAPGPPSYDSMPYLADAGPAVEVSTGEATAALTVAGPADDKPATAEGDLQLEVL